MKKVAFYTLGCKVNQYESDAIAGIFEKEGYEVIKFEEKADVYVINTCTVTNLSDRKSRQMIRRAKKNNKDSVVVVMGCYAQTSPEEVSNIPGVNLVVGTKDRNRIVEFIRGYEANQAKVIKVDNIMSAREYEDLKLDTYTERTRAFLKIQEGCNQFCTYCIIPYARGPIRSRKPEDVMNEVRELEGRGFKEVVLTGIHVASYGKDITGTSLLQIIKELHEVKGIERIRLGSVEPTTITDEFIEVAKNYKKLCPHFHISLQSGCDKTLKRMNRKYTTDEYRKQVELLRANLKDVAITTDVMVGFPGETDQDFETTYKFLKEIAFAQMHIFKYSPRKGTPAALYEDQVSPEKKEERSNALLLLSKELTVQYNSNYSGRAMEVLFEQDAAGQEGRIEGLTVNYIRVVCEGDTGLNGKIKPVRLKRSEEDYMIGEFIEKM